MVTKEKILNIKESEKLLLSAGMVGLVQKLRINVDEFTNCMDILEKCDVDLLSRFILVFGVDIGNLHFVSKETRQRMDEFIFGENLKESRSLDAVENRLIGIIQELDSYLIMEMLKRDFRRMFEKE